MTHFPARSTFKRILLEVLSSGDLLLYMAERAWKAGCPTQPMHPLFEEVWSSRQLDEAALRMLKLAARELWPTRSQTDLEQAVLRVLFENPQDGAPDPGLRTWVQTHQHILLQFVGRLASWYREVNVEGFQAIATEAQRLGWPIHFKKDLSEIDLTRLTTPPAPRLFWWSVRQNGCRVYQPNDIYDVRWAMGAREHRFGGRHYAYDGSLLQEIGEKELLKALIASLEPEHYRLIWTQATTLHMQTMSVPERLIDRPLTVKQAIEMKRRAEQDYQEVCQLKGAPCDVPPAWKLLS